MENKPTLVKAIQLTLFDKKWGHFIYYYHFGKMSKIITIVSC